jgi:hypothetical protein
MAIWAGAVLGGRESMTTLRRIDEPSEAYNGMVPGNSTAGIFLVHASRFQHMAAHGLAITMMRRV